MPAHVQAKIELKKSLSHCGLDKLELHHYSAQQILKACGVLTCVLDCTLTLDSAEFKALPQFFVRLDLGCRTGKRYFYEELHRRKILLKQII